MTRMGDDVVGNFAHGRRSGIGATAVALASQSRPATRGVQLKADEDNLGVVYVGTSGVTVLTSELTDGFPLEAGEGLFLPIDDAAKVYLAASMTGQVVHYLVV